MQREKPIRVLYSFPHKLGAGRICYTAWQQVIGLARAGAEVVVFPGSICRPVPEDVMVFPTLARGKLRIPYKLLGGRRALALHDFIVSRRIRKLSGSIDIIHTWPLGALRTLEAAAELGIPTVMERPNTHTRFGWTVVKRECERIGVSLPSGDEHTFDAETLRKEEKEYDLATYILCPSEFVLKSFLSEGFPREKLLRHLYGFDETRFFPDSKPKDPHGPLTMLFVGVCTVVKGLHFALEAWVRSPASRDGTFLIVGEFLPEYAQKLAPLLAHPSVRVLGQRNDVPSLMRKSDVLVLPSVTEGFGLVIVEAMGSGCVPIVSQACTDICRHMENALVHRVGNVEALTQHITMLKEDRALLGRLRAQGLRTASTTTWTAAGARLLEAYRSALDRDNVRRFEHQRDRESLRPVIPA
jgi:glycosyltransferase involved in cell wall biosynthesis